MTHMRIPVAALALCLDIEASAGVTGVSIDGDDVLVVQLAPVGASLVDIVTDEVVAEYSVDVEGHRRFSGFRAPEPDDDPAVVPPGSGLLSADEVRVRAHEALPVPVADEDTTTPKAKARRTKGSV